jgi:hypothetical protein
VGIKNLFLRGLETDVLIRAAAAAMSQTRTVGGASVTRVM